ncbi:hypothetical protein OSTOST_08057 [Ostertagia ostertagi]
MPPKADPKKKPVDPRSKSADSRWNAVGKNLTNAVSKSLPTMNRKGAVNGSVTKVNATTGEKKKRRRKKKPEEQQFVQPEPPKPKIVITKEDKRNKTLWRHIIWLIVLFAYSLLGGLIFSAIEGGNDRSYLVVEYEKNMDVFKRRRLYQEQLFRRFRDIDSDKSISNNRRGATLENYKLQLARHALAWYERKLGVVVEEPMMMESKWTLWGGVYYAASLYTTIEVLQRQVEKRYLRERIRRVGSELSLHSMSTVPLLSVHRTTSNMVNTTDHQVGISIKIGEILKKNAYGSELNAEGKSNRTSRLVKLDVVLPEEEQAETVPMKAALIFFFLWIAPVSIHSQIMGIRMVLFQCFLLLFTVRFQHHHRLGDVVTKTPNFIIFNLALTLVGLSVVGLCLAIVQAKVRLVFDRLIRSIDSQYRIRQIDPDVATMTLIPDEKEGIKRLIGAQPLQDRIVFIFMDEHKKCMLRERWKLRSGMVNRITQTYPSRADKYVQTGNRVYDQPGQIGSAEEEDEEDWDEEEEGDEDEEDVEYDEAGNRIVPPSTKRYIYTVFD